MSVLCVFIFTGKVEYVFMNKGPVLCSNSRFTVIFYIYFVLFFEKKVITLTKRETAN